MITYILRATSLLVVFLLVGCTAFYERQFEVNADFPITAEERDTIARQYEEFMIKSGYSPQTVVDSRGCVVYFRIRDAQNRVLPTSRIADSISIRVDPNGSLILGLHRVSSYPPDDFSVQYIEQFVKVSKEYMRETTGKQLILREVSAK